ncbi:hypothetical protein K431DRAFT_284339, partial [Polychaeton citri CBS 116435]
MANPRLPFLWPFLYRSTSEAVAVAPPVRRLAATSQRRRVSRTAIRGQQPIAQRYGTAHEYAPHLGGGTSLGPSTTQKHRADEQQPKSLPKIGEQLQRDGEKEFKAEEVQKHRSDPRRNKEDAQPDDREHELPSRTAIRDDPMMDPLESMIPTAPSTALNQIPDKPTESLLNEVPAPTSQQDGRNDEHQQQQDGQFSVQEEHAPPIHAPHIDAPRYVHHFDTYGLVKRLTDAGWDQEQAITMMKVTRLILAENMDLAKDALVSKSMVENEIYLFKAACSELRTEVTTRRKGEQEKMRAERTQLQHELDILSQRMSQESGGMKDELKGMFDDRKLAVRGEQTDMENKIQQLNYRITVSLQADAKSEVEGLRWVMTRRVITALGAVVFMVVGAIKVAASKMKDDEERAKKQAKLDAVAAASSSSLMGGSELGGSGTGGGVSPSVVGEEVMVQQGDNPAFISL